MDIIVEKSDAMMVNTNVPNFNNPVGNKITSESEVNSRQREIRNSFATRLATPEKIIACLMLIAVIAALLCMNVFHLF